MIEYFDTPALVFACANQEEAGQRARQLIAEAETPLTTPHTLAECFNALTYRLGYPPRAARDLMARNTARFEFIELDAQDYQTAINRVVEHGLTGDKIYDALHLRAALKGEAEKIHTSNKRDFSALKSPIAVEKLGP